MAQLTIENLKCGGCVKTVTKAVESIQGVGEVKVDLETGEVEYQLNEGADADKTRELVVSKLASAGYPLQGEGNTWQKAVSFVSCAKGRMS